MIDDLVFWLAEPVKAPRAWYVMAVLAVILPLALGLALVFEAAF